MKRGFISNLIKRLITRNDFILSADASGSLRIDSGVNILSKFSSGSLIIIELLDGDKFTAEEISERLRENRNRLAELNAGASHYVMELFIFDKKPDIDKVDAITAGQYGSVPRKKFLKCLSIDLTEGKTARYYKTPLSDLGIGKAANAVISEGYSEEIDISEINSQLERKKEEYRQVQSRVSTPLLTYTLIGINVLVAALLFLYSLSSGTSYGDLLLIYGAKINSNIITGEYWRLLTPIFLHADVMHLLNFAHIGGLIGGFLAAGAVPGQKSAKWYMNRFGYIALSVILAVSGIYYGFNSKQGSITMKANELETLQASQDWSRAETLAEEIIGMEPDRATRVKALWTLIVAEDMLQKYDEAVGHAKDLISIDPLNGHYILGLVYFDMGQYDSSREELLKAKELGASAEQASQIDQILGELDGQPGR